MINPRNKTFFEQFQKLELSGCHSLNLCHESAYILFYHARIGILLSIIIIIEIQIYKVDNLDLNISH